MLEQKFGRVHPALAEYREPHPSQNWLVDTFFRLHRRRPHSEVGAGPIPYSDMVTMADDILQLPRELRPLFFAAVEDTDTDVLGFLYQQQADKLEKLKKSRAGSKKHGKV